MSFYLHYAYIMILSFRGDNYDQASCENLYKGS